MSDSPYTNITSGGVYDDNGNLVMPLAGAFGASAPTPGQMNLGVGARGAIPIAPMNPISTIDPSAGSGDAQGLHPAVAAMLAAGSAPSTTDALARIADAQISSANDPRQKSVNQTAEDFIGGGLSGLGATIANYYPGNLNGGAGVQAVNSYATRQNALQAQAANQRAAILANLGQNLGAINVNKAVLDQKLGYAQKQGLNDPLPSARIAAGIASNPAQTGNAAGTALNPAQAGGVPQEGPPGTPQATPDTGPKPDQFGVLRGPGGKVLVEQSTMAPVMQDAQELRRRAAAIAPVYPEQAKAWESDAERLEKSQPYTDYVDQAKSQAKLATETYDDAIKSRTAANSLAPTVDAMDWLNAAAKSEGVTTGSYGDLKVNLAKLASTVGIPPELTGLVKSIDGMKYNEAMDTLVKALTVQDLGELKGRQGVAISNAVKSAQGGNNTSPEGNQLLTAMLKSSITHAGQAGAIADEYVKQNNNVPNTGLISRLNEFDQGSRGYKVQALTSKAADQDAEHLKAAQADPNFENNLLASPKLQAALPKVSGPTDLQALPPGTTHFLDTSPDTLKSNGGKPVVHRMNPTGSPKAPVGNPVLGELGGVLAKGKNTPMAPPQAGLKPQNSSSGWYDGLSKIFGG